MILDGKLGLKGGSAGSQLKFSFRNPPGMGLKGGAPFPMIQPTEGILKIEAQSEEAAADPEAVGSETINQDQVDFSEMDTQVMDIGLAFPDGIPPELDSEEKDESAAAAGIHPEGLDEASAESEINPISAETLLDFDLSLPEDSENQALPISMEATPTDSTTPQGIPVESSMPSLDFDLSLPTEIKQEPDSGIPASEESAAATPIQGVPMEPSNNPLDVDVSLPVPYVQPIQHVQPVQNVQPKEESSASIQAKIENVEAPSGTHAQDDESLWLDVAYTKETTMTVRHYYNTAGRLVQFKPDTDFLREPEFINKKIDLVPGGSYKFRLAAWV